MRVGVVLLMLLLVSCGKSELQPLEADDVIVAFGDSLTAGKGVGKASAYPAVLAQLTGMKVINAGISGETTAEGLQRFDSVMEAENPSLVILFEGGNDILRNHDLAETKDNLNSMIEMAKQRDIQVALVGLPRKQLLSNTAEFYNELAEAHELPIDAKIVASLLRKPAMKSDSVHFNAQGYKALAESIHEMLTEAGALN